MRRPKYNRLVRCGLLFGLLCFAGRSFGASPSAIVVLGSSTAQGAGASTYPASWVGLLTTALEPRGYSVRNVSIGGTNTADSLARFDSDVALFNPTFVILATSIVNEPAATAPQSYLQNTLALIRRVEAIGAIPVLVLPYPNNGYSAQTYSAIQDIYATLCGQGVAVLDFMDGTDDGQGHWVAGLSLDGTHPTDQGHRLLFDCIPLTLFDALQRVRPPVNPRGYGSWIQNTDSTTAGGIQIQPYTPLGSPAVSFWYKPSPSTAERALLTFNNGSLQLRRKGAGLVLLGSNRVLAVAPMPGSPASHHIALTYQSITGALKLYIDGALRSQTTLPGMGAVSTLSIGADPAIPNWNATGDRFADVIVYRAPVSQTDVQCIRAGQPPWKSVDAWLPMGISPDRPWINFAASIAGVSVRGSWLWTEDNVDLFPVPPRRAPYRY